MELSLNDRVAKLAGGDSNAEALLRDVCSLNGERIGGCVMKGLLDLGMFGSQISIGYLQACGGDLGRFTLAAMSGSQVLVSSAKA